VCKILCNSSVQLLKISKILQGGRGATFLLHPVWFTTI